MLIQVPRKCLCDNCGKYGIIESVFLNKDNVALFQYDCECGDSVLIESDIEFEIVNEILEMEE